MSGWFKEFSLPILQCQGITAVILSKEFLKDGRLNRSPEKIAPKDFAAPFRDLTNKFDVTMYSTGQYPPLWVLKPAHRTWQISNELELKRYLSDLGNLKRRREKYGLCEA